MLSLSSLVPTVRKDYAEAQTYSKVLAQWDHGQTAKVQLSRLREVWDDCTADVPYYRRMVAEGRAPRSIRTWEDFRAIPRLTRQVFQDHAKEFRRLSGPPDKWMTTAGSTGTPVTVGVWRTEEQVLRRLKLCLWIRAGYRLDSRLFLIWGHSYLLGSGWSREKRRFTRKIKDLLLGYRRVDAYKLSPEICRNYAKALFAHRPFGVIGYAAALDYFVRNVPEHVEQLQRLGCGFVMPASELPPKPDSIDLLRSAFRCPVVQEFGGVEFGQVAMKFENEPFMVFPEHCFVELDSTKEAGSEGQAVILSTLYRRYVPFIKYQQGDLVAEATVLDHGHVAAFGQLQGRVNDVIELPTGTVVHSVALLHCIHQEAAVLNIQMVMEDSGPRLRLAAKELLSPQCEQRIRHRLGQVAPELERVIIERVVDVEANRAGKRRWFVDKRSARGTSGGQSSRNLSMPIKGASQQWPATNRIREQVVEFFDREVVSYSHNFIPQRTGTGFLFRERLSVACALSANIKGCLLECASGTGEITAALLATRHFCEATVVDISRNMLEACRRRVAAEALVVPVRYEQADIFEFLDRSRTSTKYDLIVCLGLIAHTGRLQHLLATLSNHLAPDGGILFQSTLLDHLGMKMVHALTRRRYAARKGYAISWYQMADIHAAVAKAGLKIIRVQRHVVGLPFGDKLWPLGNYWLEQLMVRWAGRYGAEAIFVLGKNEDV